MINQMKNQKIIERTHVNIKNPGKNLNFANSKSTTSQKALRSESIKTKPEAKTIENPLKSESNIKAIPEPNRIPALEFKKEIQALKLKNDLMKKEIQDLKLEIGEKDKLIILLQNGEKTSEMSRTIFLKSRIINMEKYIKVLTNAMKSNNTLIADVEFALRNSLNLLETFSKIENIDTIREKLSFQIEEFKGLEAKIQDGFKRKAQNYEKLLNRSFLNIEGNVEKKSKQKNSLLYLEEEINKIMMILRDKAEEKEVPQNLHLLEICRNCSALLLDSGLKLSFEEPNEEFLDLRILKEQEKIKEISEKISKKVFNKGFNVFSLKNVDNLVKSGGISRRMSQNYDEVKALSKEIMNDVEIIIKKFEDGGKYFNIINDYIVKSSKVLMGNPDLMISLQSLISFFRNEIFVLEKSIHIFEFVSNKNALLLKDLGNFVNDKLVKICEKLNQEVLSPLDEMIEVFKHKNEIDFESYLLQISQIFEFYQVKMKNALEAVLKVGREKIQEDDSSLQLMRRVYEQIKREFLSVE